MATLVEPREQQFVHLFAGQNIPRIRLQIVLAAFRILLLQLRQMLVVVFVHLLICDQYGRPKTRVDETQNRKLPAELFPQIRFASTCIVSMPVSNSALVL